MIGYAYLFCCLLIMVFCSSCIKRKKAQRKAVQHKIDCSYKSSFDEDINEFTPAEEAYLPTQNDLKT